MHPDHCYYLVEERLSLVTLDETRRRLEGRIAVQEDIFSPYAMRLDAILDRIECEIVARNLEAAA